jgi:hypothetical protein
MSTIKQDIKDYLISEGLQPKEEKFGFFFRYQMLSFLIHWNEDDALFLRISLPGIFTSDENNRSDVLEAINNVNVERKVVKGLLLDGSVWLAAEQLLDSTPKYDDIIPRTLGMLLQARDCFYESLKQL